MYFEIFDIFEEKEIGLNSCGQIWIPRERYFENFDIIEEKDIGLNGCGLIWIPIERYFESFDIFEEKEIGLNGHGIPSQVNTSSSDNDTILVSLQVAHTF